MLWFAYEIKKSWPFKFTVYPHEVLAIISITFQYIKIGHDITSQNPEVLEFMNQIITSLVFNMVDGGIPPYVVSYAC